MKKLPLTAIGVVVRCFELMINRGRWKYDQKPNWRLLELYPGQIRNES
jgi:hypothetical protein